VRYPVSDHRAGDQPVAPVTVTAAPVATIAPSGVWLKKSLVLAMRFNEGHDPDPLMEPVENDTFTAPLNLMVVDRDGKAMRVVINRGEISYH
jgi:hypothetical protein